MKLIKSKSEKFKPITVDSEILFTINNIKSNVFINILSEEYSLATKKSRGFLINKIRSLSDMEKYYTLNNLKYYTSFSKKKVKGRRSMFIDKKSNSCAFTL